MQYRNFGKTEKALSVIGFGANRFSDEDLRDDQGLERCVDLIEQAARLGVNYFDVAHYYANARCEEIFKRAYHRLRKQHLNFYSVAKSGSNTDKDADSVMRRVEASLEHLGLEKIDFFYMWGILTREHYDFIMRKGGPYDGLIEAKKRGLVEHTVFSNHTQPEVVCDILGDDAFEGVVLSYSLQNYLAMQPVLELAEQKQVGVLVMNPLMGGLIPQNEEYFSKELGVPPTRLVAAIYQFILSHPQITSILSGVENSGQLAANVSAALSGKVVSNVCGNSQSGDFSVRLPDLCTGCGYCLRGCPAEIPISKLMQTYNRIVLGDERRYKNQNANQVTREHWSIVQNLVTYHDYLAPTSANPCLHCRKCEDACTQHLPIMKRIDKVYEAIGTLGASQQSHRHRLMSLLNEPKYRRVAFYTAGGYTRYVIREFERFFGKPAFELVVLDKSATNIGKELEGYPIYSPADILDLSLNCILITNHNFAAEIYNEISHFEEQGIAVKLLTQPQETPWVF